MVRFEMGPCIRVGTGRLPYLFLVLIILLSIFSLCKFNNQLIKYGLILFLITTFFKKIIHRLFHKIFIENNICSVSYVDGAPTGKPLS
ncbi:MAG TPA: hypothetical protein VN704_00935 [Verrucomicrobiae bacterium]|nr:hypothetical protein [Verrucomicrobiae bacterium]